MTFVTSKNDDGKNWPQFMVVIIAAISVFTAGLSLGWPAPSVPKLLDDFPFEVTNEEASYIAIISFISTVIGGLGSGLLDKIGRKRTMQLIAVPQLLSFILIALSYEIKELIYVGRFISGLGEGLSINSVPLYAGEIANPKIRGFLCSFVAILLYSGVLFVNIVGSYASIRGSALIFIAFPVLFSIAMWKMPESPYYLLMKGREEEAIRTLKFLRWKIDVSEEVEVLKKDVIRQMSETGSIKDIFTIDSNRRALFLTIGARFFQVTTGVLAFSLYIQVLLKDATESLPSEVGASLILFIQLLMTIVTTFLIDRWGRKPLLLFSVSGCFLNLLFQTIFFALKEHTSIDISVIDWFPLLMMILDIIVYSMGLGMVTTIMTSEMFSASVKPKMIFIVNALYAIFIMASTKFYQSTADTFGLTIPFGVFGCLSLIGIFFIWYYIPETKGKSLEQIQQRLKSRKSIVL